MNVDIQQVLDRLGQKAGRLMVEATVQEIAVENLQRQLDAAESRARVAEAALADLGVETGSE